MLCMIQNLATILCKNGLLKLYDMGDKKMQIDVQTLKEVVTALVKETLEKQQFLIDNNIDDEKGHEKAHERLVTITKIITGLHDKVEGFRLKGEIWECEEESERLVEQFMMKNHWDED